MVNNRYTQLITSDYGYRKTFSKAHKGIDLRTYSDHAENYKIPVAPKNNIVLPEAAIFKRKVHQEKWGWAFVFDPVDTDYFEIKFIHMHPNEDLKEGVLYPKGHDIGYTIVTRYMLNLGLGDHLHFEAWKSNNASDPKIYYDLLGIKYDHK